MATRRPSAASPTHIRSPSTHPERWPPHFLPPRAAPLDLLDPKSHHHHCLVGVVAKGLLADQEDAKRSAVIVFIDYTTGSGRRSCSNGARARFPPLESALAATSICHGLSLTAPSTSSGCLGSLLVTDMSEPRSQMPPPMPTTTWRPLTTRSI
ncbi:uncharacterized protein [Triticum aestivum]|uniref:uncharacterized protein n=1 Tax=Triticum aestivum TaxID=4565 RepID=UPI001D035558|nr:uncharacterized protein LOC123094663 [Triticum aestivum]